MSKKYNDMITKVLDKLHLNSKRKGYLYLKETIELMHEERIAIVADAYIMIASRHHVSVSAIRNCIASCIKDGIINCPRENKIEVFGSDVEVHRRNGRNYYTNAEFIIYVMNYLHKKIKKV